MRKIPCIYLLFKGQEIVYIGKSVNLEYRIPVHFDKDYDYLRYIPCDKDKLFHYELRLIKYFKPKYNRAGLLYKTHKQNLRIPLEEDLIDAIKGLARREYRSFNNYVETVLKGHVQGRKKK